MADRWVAVRSAASDAMLQAVSEAIVDVDREAPAVVRPLAPKFKPQRRKVRLQPNIFIVPVHSDLLAFSLCPPVSPDCRSLHHV